MNNLHPIAQAVQSQGRGKDTQLVHMTPGEVQGLQSLAKAHGGSLSVNPETGLVEAGFLDSLLPTILGAGLAAATGGSSLMIGAGIGGLQYARTGSISKGLMAGLGAYGGAGLASGLMGAGATGAANAANAGNVGALAGATPPVGVNSALANASGANTIAANNLAAGSTAATQEAAKIASQNLAAQQAQTAASNTFGQNLSNMGGGLKNAFSDPSTFMQNYGGSGGDLAMYGGAAAAAPLMNSLGPKAGPGYTPDNERFEYTYNPNKSSEENLAAQRMANPGGELNYFSPTYQGPNRVRVAQGGILGLAEGGTVGATGTPYGAVNPIFGQSASAPDMGVADGGDGFKYTYDPVTQTYKKVIPTAVPVAAPPPAQVSQESGGGNAQTGTEAGEQAQAQIQAQGYLTSQGLDSDSGFTGADAGGGGFGPSAPGGMAQGGLMGLAGGGTLDLSGTFNLGGQGQQGALGGARPNNSFTESPMGGLGDIFGGQQPDGGGGGLSNYGNDTRGPMARDFDFGNTSHVLGSPAAHVLRNPSYQGPMTEAQTKGSTYAAGGMAKGGFVIPADVVSALGNGSTDAGLRALKVKLGSIKPIKGKGDGLSDSINTSIDGKQPARVADGEAYIDPRTVASIGKGDPKKGAQKLYAMMDKIRKQAHGKTTQQRKVDSRKVV